MFDGNACQSLGFHSKDERVAHVEEMKSILATVVVAKDVAAHLSGGFPEAIVPDTLSPLLSCGSVSQLSTTAVTCATRNDSPRNTSSLRCEPTSQHQQIDDIELTLSVPSSGNVNSTISAIFESFLELRRRTNQRVSLHPDSLYKKIEKEATPVGVKDLTAVCSDTVGLALLQSDLTISVCDLAGNVVKRFKRLYTPKNVSSLGPQGHPEHRLHEASTVTQVSNALIAHQCACSGLAVSQKSIMSLLSSVTESSRPDEVAQWGKSTTSPSSKSMGTAVSVATPVAAGEAKFMPPYVLRLHVSDDRKLIRRLMLQEHIFRERITAQAFLFISMFATPYYRDCLSADTALRVDWILYQSHCRHRLHIAERAERVECQQQATSREEREDRDMVELSESEERTSILHFSFERLTFVALALSSKQAMIFDREDTEYKSLQAQYCREAEHLRHYLVMSSNVIRFVSAGGAEIVDDCWTQMLRWYHESFKKVVMSVQ